MCGLTVLFSYTTINNSDLGLLHACNKEMIYRGPDEQDVWHHQNIALAHVRLSIIGVSNGHQPLFNEDNSLALVCNGEIYNYVQLKTELSAKGHVFKTYTDAEVILHLYEEYGDRLCEKLEGMFAFALYDLKTGHLIVARDRAGKKPLYYANTRDGIVFSSELKIIKNYFLSEVKINYEVLRQTQQYSYSISPEETYIKGIYKVPYASYTKLTSNTVQPHFIQYYRRNIQDTFTGTYEEACREVKRLLYRAVEKRLQSEVPVAVLLSAGIDSSAIACIASQMTDKVHVISAGYSGKHKVDERAEARKLSRERGFIWDELELNEDDFSANLNSMLSKIDEPNGDVAMFAQWEIYKHAGNKGFKVLLSGNGGDELFYGYPSHNQYAQGLQWLKNKAGYFPIAEKRDAVKLWVQQILKWIMNREPYMLDKINLNMDYPVMKDFKNYLDTNHIPIYRSDWHKENFNHEIDKVYHFLHYAWLTNNCYFLADKLAMAHSVEVRCPFADLDLINFVDSLPLGIKFKDGKPKQLLKDSLKDVLPEYVLSRSKSGFTPPYTFVEKMINGYEKKHFSEAPVTFAQLVTDYFAANV
jgi:asparagine synthase (glutamine-hydrolysing)